MKKYLILLITFILTLACTKEGPFLNFAGTEGTSVSVGAEASTQEIQFSTNMAWEAASSESWLSLTPSSGDAGDHSITLKIAENPDYEQRKAMITISAGNITKSYNVIQEPKEGYIVSETSFRIGSDGGNISIPVAANIEYSASVDANSTSWLSVSQTKGLGNYTLKLSVKKNNTYGERVGYVTISAEGQTSTTLSVSQSQLDELLVGQKEFEIDNKSQEIRVPVKTNVEYTCAVLGVDSEWLTISKAQTKGLEDYYLVLAAAENKTYDGRIAQVKISGADKESVITVTQHQLDEVIVETKEFEIGSAGGTIQVPISSNIEYSAEILGNASWLKIQTVQSKGLENYKLLLSVSKNETYDARVGQVKVSGAGKECMITIVQSQLDELIISDTSYEIDRIGGKISVDIQSNVEYICEVLNGASTWISASKLNTKGLETSQLVLTVSENKANIGRVGQVKVSGAGKDIILTLTQSQFDGLFVPVTEYEIDEAGGKINIEVQSNVEYTYSVTSGNDWLSLSQLQTKSLATSTLVVHVSPNGGNRSRLGTITISGAGKEIIVSITQKKAVSVEGEGDDGYGTGEDFGGNFD